MWSQKLDKELSCNAPCSCRHLHGHSGKVTVFLEAETLNEQGMVLDFVELSFVKKMIDKIIDHKFLIDRKDPILGFLVTQHDLNDERFIKYKYYSEPILYDFCKPEINEMEESLVVVNFMPTSENLAKWMFDMINDVLPTKLLKQVEWQETEKSKSIYVRE